MAEHIHLVGVEQIQSAANTIRAAASEINRAANTISQALNDHERIMREFMTHIDDTIKEIRQYDV